MNNEIEKLKEEIAMLKEEVIHLRVLAKIAYEAYKKTMGLIALPQEKKDAIDRLTKELDAIYSRKIVLGADPTVRIQYEYQ